MKLVIPDDAKPSLELLARSSAEELRALEEALTSGRPAPTAPHTPAIVETLGGLCLFADSVNAGSTEVAAAVVSAIQSDSRWHVIANPDGLKPFSDFLSRVLDKSSSFRRLARAGDIGRQYEHVLNGFRIICDIRPVFVSREEGEQFDMVIAHVLKLDTIGPSGAEGEYFVKLDTKDLRKLADACDRALDEAEIVRRTLAAQGNRVIETP